MLAITFARADTHTDWFAYASHCTRNTFQQLFVIIIILVKGFQNSQNDTSIKCKHLACDLQAL